MTLNCIKCKRCSNGYTGPSKMQGSGYDRFRLQRKWSIKKRCFLDMTVFLCRTNITNRNHKSQIGIFLIWLFYNGCSWYDCFLRQGNRSIYNGCSWHDCFLRQGNRSIYNGCSWYDCFLRQGNRSIYKGCSWYDCFLRQGNRSIYNRCSRYDWVFFQQRNRSIVKSSIQDTTVFLCRRIGLWQKEIFCSWLFFSAEG